MEDLRERVRVGGGGSVEGVVSVWECRGGRGD